MAPKIFEDLEVFSECNLERVIFAKLAAKSQVGVFQRSGNWQAVDTERELQIVTQIYLENKRPWSSLGGL